jgi:hypothetical protein
MNSINILYKKLQWKIKYMLTPLHKKQEKFEEMCFWHLTEWLEVPEKRKIIIIKIRKLKLNSFHGIPIEELGDDFTIQQIELIKNGFNTCFKMFYNKLKIVCDYQEDSTT